MDAALRPLRRLLARRRTTRFARTVLARLLQLGYKRVCDQVHDARKSRRFLFLVGTSLSDAFSSPLHRPMARVYVELSGADMRFDFANQLCLCYSSTCRRRPPGFE